MISEILALKITFTRNSPTKKKKKKKKKEGREEGLIVEMTVSYFYMVYIKQTK